MKAITCLTSLFLFACSGPEEGPKQMTVKEEAYVILNALIEDDQLFLNPLCAVPLGQLELEHEEWTSEFDPRDREFMRRCQDSLTEELFEAGELVSWDMRHHEWTPLQIVPENDTTFYAEVSWPMFDEKREKALVHFVFNANGMLSGSGRTMLYVKTKGRWKHWKVYASWIS